MSAWRPIVCALLFCASVASAQDSTAPAAAPPSGPADAGVVTSSGPLLPDGFAWSPVAEVFGEYQLRSATGLGVFHVFDVPRVQLGLEAQWQGASARVLLEGTRSTEGGALLGTAGDSVVVRLREGFGGYQWRWLDAKLGMIAMPVVAELERAFRFRALTPDGLERYRLQSPADLGASIRLTLPYEFGWAAVTAVNGEGYTFREINNGKNLDVSALVKPFALTAAAPLGVLMSARWGTSGLGSVRSDRFGGGVMWSAPWLGIGATAFYAVGVADDGGLRALLAQAFARGMLFERLLWAVRVHWLKRDLDASADDSLTELLAGVGFKVAGPLEVFACFQKSWLSPIARASLPGVEATSGRLVVRIRWPDAPLFN